MQIKAACFKGDLQTAIVAVHDFLSTNMKDKVKI